jgi:hypothetical protein
MPIFLATQEAESRRLLAGCQLRQSICKPPSLKKGLAKVWKEPRCPTTDEWIKKMWYLYTMEFYAAMKKNEMLSFTGKGMELENIILSEVRLDPKTKNRMFSLI